MSLSSLHRYHICSLLSVVSGSHLFKLTGSEQISTGSAWVFCAGSVARRSALCQKRVANTKQLTTLRSSSFASGYRFPRIPKTNASKTDLLLPLRCCLQMQGRQGNSTFLWRQKAGKSVFRLCLSAQAAHRLVDNLMKSAQ